MNKAIEIDAYDVDHGIDFSICSLVTNKQQYSEMLTSFEQAGFSGDRCEFIYIDNSNSNKYDAYDGLNHFLQLAKGKYIILCHQDLLLHDHGVDHLERVIDEMDSLDEQWAVLGNAGGVVPGKLAIRITDPFYGENTKLGSFPAQVGGLDENFILVKRSANLALSRDVGGFHMYGTDLCVIADVLGYHAYAVDFHLHHVCGEVLKGVGRKTVETPMSFNSVRQRFVRKYQRAFRSRWLQTTCTIVYLSGSRIGSVFGNRKLSFSIMKRIHRLFG